MSAPSSGEQWDILSRNAERIEPAADLREKLASGRPLRIKLGLDPTADHVTLGWAVVLRKLRAFQDLGHTAVLIVGDFTARIGDPSLQNKTRPMLTKDEVDAHATKLLDQFKLVLDTDRLEIRNNSEWLEPLDTAELLRLSSAQTVAQMLRREDFAKRYAEESPITVTEFLYPLLQGYDSYAISADVELGGTDQTFNLLVGRDVQRLYGQEPQAILTVPLLEGTDGVQKMSQSLGNYIAVTEAPGEMFGKLMRVPDELMGKYLRLTTDLAERDVTDIERRVGSGDLRPADAKRDLAEAVVRLYHGADAARAARERFDRVHVAREVPEDIEEAELPSDCLDGEGTAFVPLLLKLVGLASSTNEGRRLVSQGGVRLDGERVGEGVPADELRGRVLQVGKRRFVRLR